MGKPPLMNDPSKQPLYFNPHNEQFHHPEDDNPVFVKKILPVIKYVANIIIVLLILALVITILYKLYILFFKDLISGDFNSIINDLLLTLILIELFTILYSYLQKHYIKVERVVELGMISIIREMLFKVEVFEANKIYAIAVLLVAFGALFFIEKYYSRTRNV
ncbi:TPA: hypothetical protein HA235_03570 [Candidatus Woesearchaeota archaeon]|nr:phosphate-starvation-inducible PsiE family protein [Candidatus Woesearchaeota archaeon]HIH31760.1 hypothetical protein [Candidatus Woesearchaeota archaeon]HIH54679.1 hypothetical protein [Candidatus Woesearchaeota archaeon]HIJ01566.1 hypothetical protein [Candidatus Woesearchaeota archaeon]HIJ13969.1 hypothetical protein [Candidatus Woesearchaeota archaeon]